MRPIPASILEKLKKLQQTQAENADPRINLVMQRTKRYIEQGSLLQPFDLWTRPNLGPLDIAIRRENRLTGPDKLFLIYVEGGQAHVAWIDYIKSIEESNEWEHLYTLGPAVDVAAEFDGHWERTSPEAEVCFDSPAQWTLVTDGEPYFFRVLPDGSLVVQQNDGEPVTLAESGVTKIAALRSWKNVYRWNHDHGLIAAYIRGGAVRYRSYANQGTEQDPLPPAWEPERDVTELPSPAQSVALFRTNDYRTGFLAESDGEIHWTVTDRNWAGMGIRQHTIVARADDVFAILIPILYRDAYAPDHTIAARAADVTCLFSPEIYPQVIGARNIDEQTILIYTDLPLVGDLTGLESAFSVTDELSAPYAVSATKRGAVFPSRLFTFERNSLAYHPETGEEIPEDTPVFVDFAGGRKGSLMVEGTTNLLSENQSSAETSLTGIISIRANSDRSLLHSFHGDYSIEATATDANPVIVIAVGILNSGYAAGTPFTASAYAWGVIGKRLRVTINFSGGVNPGSSASRNFTYNGEDPLRIHFTRNLDYADRTSINLWVYAPDHSVGEKFYVDGLQIERSPYLTPWHPGGSTRANPLKRITLPEALPEEFGVGVAAKMLHAHDTATRTFWQAGDYRCYFDAADNKLKMTNGVVTAQTAVTWAAGDIVGVYAGRKNRKLFVQAKIAGTVGDCAIAPGGEIESGTTLYLGSKADGSENINAVIGGFIQHDPHEIDPIGYLSAIPGGGE